MQPPRYEPPPTYEAVVEEDYWQLDSPVTLKPYLVAVELNTFDSSGVVRLNAMRALRIHRPWSC